MLGAVLQRLINTLIGIDVFANAIIGLAFGGEPYQTISCRIGLSLQSGGWATHIWMPAWFKIHCRRAVYVRVV